MRRRILHSCYLFCAAFMLLFGISACSAMHDDLASCPSGVQVILDVKYGGKYSDTQRFADDLKNVTIWVFDQDSVYVGKFTDTAKRLVQNDSVIMNLPISPGKYNMVVWTGIEDTNYEMKPSISKMKDLTVRVARDQNNRLNKKLSPLWHGRIENAEVKASEYTRLSVELTKNTNTIIAVLHETSGKSLDSDDYTFEIVAENGYMDYNNQFLPDAPVHYDPYFLKVADVRSVTARNDDPQYALVKAELSTLRLMADNKNARFVVTEKKTGFKLLDINLIEYLLFTCEEYNEYYNTSLSPQAYLDSEDVFSIIFFFVPSGQSYICTDLQIKKWNVRINNANL